MDEESVKTFKFTTQIDSTKQYILIELGKGLDSMELSHFKALDSLGFISMYGQSNSMFLDSYIFIEESQYVLNLKKFKDRFRNFYPKELGKESGKNLKQLETSIEQAVKTSITENVKENQIYKVSDGRYKNLIVKLKTYKPDKSICIAFVFNKEEIIEIESKFLEKSDYDESIFKFSENFNRFNLIENSYKYVILDMNFFILWSIISFPNFFSKDANQYVGSSYGFYFTLLKLKQRFSDYKFICVFGKDDFIDYYFNLNDFSKYDFKENWETLKSIVSYNLNWCKDLAINLGYETYMSNQHSTKTIISTILKKLNRDPHVVIYSRDPSYLKFIKSNVNVYYNKLFVNDFDQILTPEKILQKYKIEKISAVDYVLGLLGEPFSFSESLKPSFLRSFYSVLHTEGLQKANQYLNSIASLKEFMQRSQVENLSNLKTDTVLLTAFTRIKRQSKKSAVLSILESNSFYRESSVLDLTYPILISII